MESFQNISPELRGQETLSEPVDDQSGSETEKRISQTNVQTEGIDEPDIVKTDGTNIFLSIEQQYYVYEDLPDQPVVRREENTEEIAPLPELTTDIIQATPPESLAKRSSIEQNGELLLSDENLVIIGYDALHGYDISDPDQPILEWVYTLDENTTIQTARLLNGMIFLMTETYINTDNPCPIDVFTSDTRSVSLQCTDIYYPDVLVPTDTTYSVFSLDPSSGSVSNQVSFIGTSSYSLTYMSEQNIYITYTYYVDPTSFLFTFFKDQTQDLFPEDIRDKIEQLETYSISMQAKLTELEVIIDTYLNTLAIDERSRIETEMSERMQTYYQQHQRELEKTGIIKIDRESLEIRQNATVPGHPLNQFSMDEYNDHLRIATTIGGGLWTSEGSVNDVYILNQDLEQTGRVQDMGLDERIFAVRFIADKGYVVTYKVTDPFYVLNFADPNDPKLEGELKIPGYSSYLHPLTEDAILGVGKEDMSVKVSLFDVSNPQSPQEVSKYTLNEGWSDVLESHHAFLLDSAHSIFFIPAGNAGYIFSYEENAFDVIKRVGDIQARRAIYIGDNLYIIGNDKIIVLDENTWEEVARLEL